MVTLPSSPLSYSSSSASLPLSAAASPLTSAHSLLLSSLHSSALRDVQQRQTASPHELAAVNRDLEESNKEVHLFVKSQYESDDNSEEWDAALRTAAKKSQPSDTDLVELETDDT